MGLGDHTNNLRATHALTRASHSGEGTGASTRMGCARATRALQSENRPTCQRSLHLVPHGLHRLKRLDLLVERVDGQKQCSAHVAQFLQVLRLRERVRTVLSLDVLHLRK